MHQQSSKKPFFQNALNRRTENNRKNSEIQTNIGRRFDRLRTVKTASGGGKKNIKRKIKKKRKKNKKM